MAGQLLQVFAVNTELEGRHTYLSRSKGDTCALPDLAGWLGLPQGGLNLDEIELFPVDDLAGMALSDYVTTAFDLEEAPSGQITTRMNALDGHVLLIPEAAIAGEIALKSELTQIASLPLAQPDHSADALRPAPASPTTPSPAKEPVETQPSKRFMFSVMVAFILAVLLVTISKIW